MQLNYRDEVNDEGRPKETNKQYRNGMAERVVERHEARNGRMAGQKVTLGGLSASHLAILTSAEHGTCARARSKRSSKDTK